MSSEMIAAAFEAFMAALDVADTTAAFASLVALTGPSADASSPHFYQHMRDRLREVVNYKRKSLFVLLDARIETAAALRASNTENRVSRIVVSGGGPCGLRAAVEAAMLGHSVTVFELRGEFSRHNVIKTWQSTITDLMNLGLSHFYPAFKPHGHLHLGIREIQMCLLKVCLLLGVQLHYRSGVCGLVDPESDVVGSVPDSWSVWSLPEPAARLRLKARSRRAANPGNGDSSDADVAEAAIPEELALRPGEQDTSRLAKKNRVDYFETPVSTDGAIIRPTNFAADAASTDDIECFKSNADSVTQIPFDALVIAEGETSSLLRNLGFARKVWRFSSQIGIVVNLNFSPSAKTSGELKIDEFVVSRQSADWRSTVLAKLDVELENLEYMRGLGTHFFVCTVKKQSLLKSTSGVIKEDRPTVAELLSPENVDLAALRSFGKMIARVVGVPDDAPFSDKHGVQIFDFSCKGMCTDTIKELTSAGTQSIKSLVFPIGDALVNPFWPQGLGINRGFHTALDAIHSIHIHTIQPLYPLTYYDRLTSFRLTEWYAFSEAFSLTKPAMLPTSPMRGDSSSVVWTADPLTRYNPKVFRGIHKSDLEMSPSPTLPRRYREHFGLLWSDVDAATSGRGFEASFVADEGAAADRCGSCEGDQEF